MLSISCRWCRLAKGQTLSSYKYDDETAGPWLGGLTKAPGKGSKGPQMDPTVIDTAVTVALQLAQVGLSLWQSNACAACLPCVQQPVGSPGHSEAAATAVLQLIEVGSA